MKKSKEPGSAGLQVSAVIPVFLFVWAICVLALGIFRGNKTIDNFFALQDMERQLFESVEAKKAEKRNIEIEIERLTHSSSYARKTLIDRYHVLGEGEEIVQFSDDN